MRAIETGKYKHKTLAQCPPEYLVWASKHRKNFSPENRWVSDDANKLLTAQAAIETATAQKIDGNANWDEWQQSLMELQARHEAEMAVRIAEHIVSTPPRVDLGLKGNFGAKAFSILR
jgi:hypothetical protein